jgi:glutamate-5-semialdehyde dehydrogenase
MNMLSIGKNARAAWRILRGASAEKKNAVLLSIAERLSIHEKDILEANRVDVAQGGQAGLSPAMLDRLRLDAGRLSGMAADLRSVCALPDPVGEVFDQTSMPNGLQVHKLRVPLGVLGVIFEARPNVTIDVAGLAIKTGNAVVLRGGSETLNSNRTLVRLIQRALEDNNLPPEAVQFIDDPDRQRVMELLQMQDYIDMLIPRGGAGLHQFCRENSRIPVITGGIGICHLYVDESADLEAALGVIRNAKIQRPTVCNALDTVLVHRAVAQDFLPDLVGLLEMDGVKFRADNAALQALQSSDGSLPVSVSSAGPDDFDTEWLSLVLGLRVVTGLEQAVDHILQHSTGHSDGILTQDETNAWQFVAEVDSAAVYVNASTRFTDGGQLGLGAEVAISTQRLHARGPMALRELTTYKWVIRGNNHVRE